MPTANEIRVLKLLSAIEIPPTAGQTIQSWGNEAVTIVCEAALGALLAIDSDKARASVATYKAASPVDLPHRGSRGGESVLSSTGW